MNLYDINLKHLAYFSKVARLGSINKAAQLLYISQSHLGKIIHDLEETVGVPLLNRSRQRLQCAAWRWPKTDTKALWRKDHGSSARGRNC